MRAELRMEDIRINYEKVRKYVDFAVRCEGNVTNGAEKSPDRVSRVRVFLVGDGSALVTGRSEALAWRSGCPAIAFQGNHSKTEGYLFDESAGHWRRRPRACSQLGAA